MNKELNDGTEADSSTLYDVTTSAKLLPNPVLCDVLSLKEAKMLAMLEGKKIRHRYFMPDEYIVYKKDKWLTEEGVEVPYSYWLCMVPEMQTDWFVHIASQSVEATNNDTAAV